MRVTLSALHVETVLESWNFTIQFGYLGFSLFCVCFQGVN